MLIGFIYVLLGIAFFLEGLEWRCSHWEADAAQLTTPEFLALIR